MTRIIFLLGGLRFSLRLLSDFLKVNINKDPALYQRFLKRMEEILERYQGNWDYIVQEFNRMKDDLAKGRKDEVKEFDNREALFQNVKEVKDGCIVIPRILE